MLLSSRRFSVWLVSFLAVLVIYFIYNRVSRTPTITTGDSGQPAVLAADVCDSNERVGKVGEVGVGVVKNVRYTTLNANKQVEREFGFEKLLHQDGNDWEIEKPYMRIYRKSFKCEIRGDRAKVTVEVSGKRVTPKEGQLTGNVTIRIWPQSKKGPGEGVMHLDDITFDGDKSLFSTPGMVEFVSDKVRMAGTGMELIYNSDDDRLEFLKIAKLQSLHIKRWTQGMMFQSSVPKGKNAGDTGPVQEGKEGGKRGQDYKCELVSNVVIETPRERLLADIVSINDILLHGGASEDADINAGSTGGAETVEPNRTIGGRGDANSGAEDGDVSISCDGGIVVTPMDSATAQKAEDGGQRTEGREQRTEDRRDGKTTFRGERVDYSVATGEAVATGPSLITFDVNDKTEDAMGNPATVVIASQRQVKFSPAMNMSTFEGDCRCTATQEMGDVTRQHIVLADKIEVDLAKKEGNEGPGTSLNVSRFIATGDDVHLASTKRLGERLLAGLELKCARMEYDTVAGNFFAAGPGLIKVDNSQTDEPQKGLSRFSLRRKCYAFLRQFDTLEYDRTSNRLAADSQDGSLLVDYFPVVEKGESDKVGITASHVEGELSETPQGRMELKGLTAKGAVTYQDKNTQVVGSEFVYDANSSSIDIRGDRSRPCYFNGAIIDSAKYNVKSGRWSTRLKGPGAIR